MPRRYIRLVSRHGKHIIEHDFIRPEAPAVAGSPVDSIDYAVMEQYRQGSSYAACRVLERYGFMEALYEKTIKIQRATSARVTLSPKMSAISVRNG